MNFACLFWRKTSAASALPLLALVPHMPPTSLFLENSYRHTIHLSSNPPQIHSVHRASRSSTLSSSCLSYPSHIDQISLVHIVPSSYQCPTYSTTETVPRPSRSWEGFWTKRSRNSYAFGSNSHSEVWSDLLPSWRLFVDLEGDSECPASGCLNHICTVTSQHHKGHKCILHSGRPLLLLHDNARWCLPEHSSHTKKRAIINLPSSYSIAIAMLSAQMKRSSLLIIACAKDVHHHMEPGDQNRSERSTT